MNAPNLQPRFTVGIERREVGGDGKSRVVVMDDAGVHLVDVDVEGGLDNSLNLLPAITSLDELENSLQTAALAGFDVSRLVDAILRQIGDRPERGVRVERASGACVSANLRVPAIVSIKPASLPLIAKICREIGERARAKMKAAASESGAGVGVP